LPRFSLSPDDRWLIATAQERPRAMNNEIQLSRAYPQMLRKMKRKSEAREVEELLRTMLSR
jgi:hypothetical protein